MNKYLVLILCFFMSWIHTGCVSDDNNTDNLKVENPKLSDSISEKVDTNAIELKIVDLYKKTETYYNDSLKRIDSAYFYAGHVMCKLNLNSDEWLDYFVIEDNMGGPTFGIFHDGKTGDAIDFFDLSHIWSRPGIDIEYEIVDVDCSDNQNEMLIRYGSGGTVGSYYDCDIYRFDDSTQSVKRIFTETISAYNWEDSGVEELEINYIDINYKVDSCISEIYVQEAKMNVEGQAYSLEMVPRKNGKITHYIFDSGKNEFVIK